MTFPENKTPASERCDCRQKPEIINGVRDPVGVFAPGQLKLAGAVAPAGAGLSNRSGGLRVFVYCCQICGQYWEKQPLPHPYGYVENWRKVAANTVTAQEKQNDLSGNSPQISV